jgi:multidrug efflux pump subunit AcrB
MKKWVEWFTENSVAANLLMFLVVVGGILSMFSLRKEVIPEINTERITVTVPYPGATPAEVEESICIKIEEEVQDLEAIKRVTSSSAEGVGIVVIEALEGSDLGKLLGEVKNRVDAIDTFPEDAKEPVVQQLEVQTEVLTIALAAPTSEMGLHRLGERIRDEISVLDGITRVELIGGRPFEIKIQVSEENLRKWGISFSQVADAIRMSSMDLPAGTLKTRGGEVLIRGIGQAYAPSAFEKIPVLTQPGGERVLLGDIAEVVDGFEDLATKTLFDGKNSLLIKVYRVGDQSAIAVAETTKKYLELKKQQLPKDVSLTVWLDNARLLNGRLDLLMRNGRIGLLLVFLTLALFLRLRLAFWTAFGIPISFLGALWLLPGLHVTINLISLFGFIVVLGIVVDDAIVVGENVFSHLAKGKPIRQAIKDGTTEVLVPVVFAVLTTIAAFLPMLGLPGTYGQFSRNIPLVVIACLCFSLVESLFVLPSHLRHLKVETKDPVGWNRLWLAFQSIFTRGLEKYIRFIYKPSLDVLLRWRYLTLAVAATTFFLTVGMVAAGWLKFTFFPKIDADNVSCALTMPIGTPSETTQSALNRITKAVEQLKSEFEKKPGSVIRHTLSTLGSQPYRIQQSRNSGGNLLGTRPVSHMGEVTLELTPSEDRSIGSRKIADRWRELVGKIPDAIELSFTGDLVSSGADINLQLTSPDIAVLRAARQEVKDMLASYPGVYDLSDSFRVGKKEVHLRLKPSAESLGLRQVPLSRQVRQAVYGEEAQRVQRGRDDVPVMVRYPDKDLKSLYAIEDMRVRFAGGDEVPLSSVASVSFSRTLAEIKRSDRNRAVTVTANVDKDKGDQEKILRDLKGSFLPQLKARYPGLNFSFEGTQREQRSFMEGMKEQAIFSIILIFILLAIPFRSYLQPLIVMSVIPFGIVGAVWGHILLGMDLTMMSLIGLLALSGVVVNDSLVVVDFINRARRKGANLHRAVREAGIQRFRPILLTSATTFAGLSPMLLEKSLQARFLIPMAVSLGFGIVFSTVITLVLVPCLYLVLEDVTMGRRNKPNMVKKVGENQED